MALLDPIFSFEQQRKIFSTGWNASSFLWGLILAGACMILWSILIVMLFFGLSAADVVLLGIFVPLIGLMIGSVTSLAFLDRDSKKLVMLVGKLVPGSMPVVIKDFQHDTYYSLAWPSAEDERWQCPVYYGTGVGQVSLNRNGSCGDPSYVYFWQPLRPSDRMHFFLENPDMLEFDEVNKMTRSDMTDMVKKMRKHALNTN